MEIIKNNLAIRALVAAAASFLLLCVGYFVFEPTLGHAVADNILVTQTITAEISMAGTLNDVTMTPSLASLSGGIAYGTSTIVVSTNSATGYLMTIHFATTSGSAAMYRNGGGGQIANYVPTATGTPDFLFDSAELFGQFGYSVVSDSAGDLDLSFRDDSAACGTGSNNTPGRCWMNPTTSVETIINRSTATAAAGSTTTIQFQVDIPPNPNPTIPTGTYTATATLTAVTQ